MIPLLLHPKSEHYFDYIVAVCCDAVFLSRTLDEMWPKHQFISGGNPHLTSRFCEVVLGPTTISKMVSEPLQDPLGHLLSGFRYRTTHHLCL